MTNPANVATPPARFNLSQHPLAANAKRPDKAAFIDDLGAQTDGALD